MVALPLVLIEEDLTVVAVVSKKIHDLKLRLTKFSLDRSRRLPAVIWSARAGFG